MSKNKERPPETLDFIWTVEVLSDPIKRHEYDKKGMLYLYDANIAVRLSQSLQEPDSNLQWSRSWKDLIPVKVSGLSTKKLEATGFKYESGLEEMYDGAIKSCKEKGFL
ncbi:hypothetical protein CASFOL_036164 [Castilleja foliolosa]|uniref:Uncharacterized protein n=1 Tax=Castilleja foliolosa TaxID=1961234 RepID=A0ABD3BVG3_9LAMI